MLLVWKVTDADGVASHFTELVISSQLSEAFPIVKRHLLIEQKVCKFGVS